MIDRCNALNPDGNQCKNKGTRTIKYQGDHEIYTYSCYDKYPISWVKIKVCRNHYEENFQK